MKILVFDHYDGRERMYEGTPEHIEERLLFDFPFLRSFDLEDRGDLEGTLEYLDSTAAYEVTIEDDDMSKSEADLGAQAPIVEEMLGFQPLMTSAFMAAKWMSGGTEVNENEIRQALYAEDGNVERAALLAYGFEPTEENLNALKSIQAVGKFEKAEPVVPTAQSIEAAHPEGEDCAEAVRRAYKDQFVVEVQLNGKHSKGSLLARDQATKITWLLKPGSGGAGPEAGAEQDPSTPSAREAAWYHVAKEWGLYNWYPRAELLLIDGKQFAAMQLMPWDFKSMEKRKSEDPHFPRKTLHPYLSDGVLHQWAFMDAILGNPDSHGNNIMVNPEGELKLIDHGSAFAGDGFDPAGDKKSFVPAYLRAWAPQDKNFNSLSPDEKLSYLPHVEPRVANRLKVWVAGLSAGVLEAILLRYGINPAPSLARLAKLKTACLESPPDTAIDRFWVTV
jgi:hypothetical protein